MGGKLKSLLLPGSIFISDNIPGARCAEVWDVVMTLCPFPGGELEEEEEGDETNMARREFN